MSVKKKAFDLNLSPENTFLEKLTVDELKEWCEYYGTTKGKNKTEVISKIIACPKYKPDILLKVMESKKLLNKLKIPVLRKICEDIGATKSGKKSDIIINILQKEPSFDYTKYANIVIEGEDSSEEGVPGTPQIVISDNKKDGAIMEQKFKSYVSVKHDDVVIKNIVKNGYSFSFSPFGKNTISLLEVKSIDGAVYGIKLEVSDLPKISEFMDSSLFDCMVKEFLGDSMTNIIASTEFNIVIVLKSSLIPKVTLMIPRIKIELTIEDRLSKLESVIDILQKEIKELKNKKSTP